MKAAAVHPPSHRTLDVRKVLIACGIASSTLYVGMNTVIPMLAPGYSVAGQTVSELSAIGAPTRPIWVTCAAFYTVLIIAFGVGVGLSAGRSWWVRIIGLAIVVQGGIGPFWPPMHQRSELAANLGTQTDVLHIVYTAIWGALCMISLLCGAFAFGRRFRWYSLATLVVLLLFGFLTSLLAPDMQANRPTPMIGVWERINIAAFMLWIVALACKLWRPKASTL